MKYDKRISREIALQVIYQVLSGRSFQEAENLEWVEEIHKDDLEFRNKDFIIENAVKIVEGLKKNFSKIEEIFEKYYKKNKETISIIDKALLYLGIYLVKFDKSLSVRIAIDEMVEISKSFGSTNKTYKLVNSFLDSVVKNQTIFQ